MKNKIQPEIRFSDFVSEWKKYKLGENSHILTGGTPNTKIKDYWEPKEIPWMSSGEINKKRLVTTDNMISNLGLENSSARWVKENSVLVALAGQGKTRGTVAINEIPITTNQSIAAIETNDLIDSEFLYQNLGRRYEELRMISSGDGTRGGLNKKIISDIEIFTPNKKEQKEISKLCKQLDDLLSFHQQELTTLKQTKQGFLQKMFPKEGEKLPEVRFPGFTDDWELRKLGDVTSSYSGGTPSASNKSYYGGKIPFIRSAEVNSDSTELLLTEEGLNNSSAKMVEVGDILYALYGATSGEVGISRISGAINQAILAIKPNENHDSRFIMQWLRLQKQKIIDKYLQGGQGNLSGSIVKDLHVSFPSFEEQKKIGEFFKGIDDLLTLHQRELELLQLTKKAFLQKLFV